MASIYTLTVSLDFAAAHILHGYDGPCSRLHGHNWKVLVEVEAKQLDEIGMGVDFSEIKRKAKTFVGAVDHQFLNELPAFKDVNPSAENVAAWFYRELSHAFNKDGVRLTSITIFENERCSVRYSEL